MFQRLVILTALLVVLAPLQRADARGESAEAAYQHARKGYYSLKEDAERRQFRHHWRNVADAFLGVAARHPKSSRAPDALFTAADLLNELSRISRHEDDLRDAIRSYERLLAEHPKHRLSDDGGLALAKIQLERIDKPELARKTLEDVLAVNGKGDRARELRQLLASMPAPKKAAVAKSAPAKKPATREVPKKSEPAKETAKAPTTGSPKSEPVKARPSEPRIAEAPTGGEEAAGKEDDTAGSLALVEAIEAAAREARVEAPTEPRSPRVNGRALAGRSRVINVEDLEHDSVSAPGQAKAAAHDEVAAAPPRPSTTLGTAIVDTVSRLARGESEEPTPEEMAALTAKLKGAAKRQGNAEFTLAEQLGLKVRRVVIDAGHGGHDTGAIGKNGTREKDVALAISKRVAAILEEAGLEVLLTRDDDTFVRLEDRTKFANDARGDLFISIHCNAAVNRKLRGVETYTLNLSSDRYAIRLAARENAMSEKSISDLQFILADLATKANTEESTRLAEHVHGSIVGSLKAKYSDIKDLGNKEALFYVLLGARMPAILVETSFLSHPAEEKRLASKAYQERLARAIADGVEAFLGKRDRVAKVQ